MEKLRTTLITKQQVAIAGQVVEWETDNGQKVKHPMAGALVEIIAMPIPLHTILSLKALEYGTQWDKMSNRPDRAITAGDGYFTFVDLPIGKYTLAASLPGCVTKYGTWSCTLDQDSNKRILTKFGEILLHRIGIKGKVTDSTTKEGIESAKIQIENSPEWSFSNLQGAYRLGIEPLTMRKTDISIIVSAKDYIPVAKSLNLKKFTVNEVNFILSRKPGDS